MFELDIRNFDVVPRWNTVRMNNPQNLAQHSFYVAVYTGQLVDWLNGKVEASAANPIDKGAALQYALWHDAVETASGDPPGPYKRLALREDISHINRRILGRRFSSCEWAKPMDGRIPLVVKVADTMDEWLHLTIDHRSGNRHVDQILKDSGARVETAVKKLGLIVPLTLELLKVCRGQQYCHTVADYQYVLDNDGR